MLARFIGIPVLLLSLLALLDRRQGRRFPAWLRAWSPGGAILLMATVALLYTTPWDNYLVANRIWWYDPALVTGVTFGWVPIEEYTFFVVQTWMTGLWVLTWARRLAQPDQPASLPPHRDAGTLPTAARWAPALVASGTWAIWLALLLFGWQRGLYLAILLTWALPPMVLQLGFGADILWRHRRLVALGLLPPTLYLWVVDGLAISGGTWTINPANTVGLNLAGILPLEEAVFFLVTNTLIVFGIVLLLAPESHKRVGDFLRAHRSLPTL